MSIVDKKFNINEQCNKQRGVASGGSLSLAPRKRRMRVADVPAEEPSCVRQPRAPPWNLPRTTSRTHARGRRGQGVDRADGQTPPNTPERKGRPGAAMVKWAVKAAAARPRPGGPRGLLGRIAVELRRRQAERFSDGRDDDGHPAGKAAVSGGFGSVAAAPIRAPARRRAVRARARHATPPRPPARRVRARGAAYKKRRRRRARSRRRRGGRRRRRWARGPSTGRPRRAPASP